VGVASDRLGDLLGQLVAVAIGGGPVGLVLGQQHPGHVFSQVRLV
jgi:hypothetical protein